MDGVNVDTWTAELTPAGTGLQIRHRIKRAVALAPGDVIRLFVTPVSGTPAKVDYVEIYGRQLSTPLAPESLTANAVSATKIALAWEGWTGEATSATYDIFRATSLAGPFTNIATGVTGTTWMDSHLVQGTPYFYKVTMTTALGTSPASETVSATPHPFSSISTLESSADAYVRGRQHCHEQLRHCDATRRQKCHHRRQLSEGIHPLRSYRARHTLHAERFTAVRVASAWDDDDAMAGLWIEKRGRRGILGREFHHVEQRSGQHHNVGRCARQQPGGVSRNACHHRSSAIGEVLELRSAALDAFLLADTNNQVTFILTRASTAAGNSIVASRENTTLAAPALEFDRSVPAFIEVNASTERYKSSSHRPPTPFPTSPSPAAATASWC